MSGHLLDVNRTAADTVVAHLADHNALHARYNLGGHSTGMHEADDPQVEDDLFTSESLDNKWTRLSRVSPSVTLVPSEHGLGYGMNELGLYHELDVINQSLSAVAYGDYIQAGFSVQGASNFKAYVGFSNTDQWSAGRQVGVGFYRGGYNAIEARMQEVTSHQNVTGGLVNGSYLLGQGTMEFHVRLIYVASNEFTLQTSNYGTNWHSVSGHVGFSTSAQVPTHMDIGLQLDTSANAMDEALFHYVQYNRQASA